jgi:hypothetical protein
LSNKYISYSDVTLLNFIDKTVLLACGVQSATKHIISEISVNEDENKQKQSNSIVRKNL